MLLAACIASAQTAHEGRAIMRGVDQRPRGADEVLRSTWRLIDKGGKERVRETRFYWTDRRVTNDGLVSKRLIVFDAPATIKDTAFLVHSRSDAAEDDLRWVYLPALRKVRRIAGSGRDKLFAGSDFTYDDLAERSLDEDEHTFLREEAREQVLHLVVESRPRGDSPYEKRIQWVNPANHTLSRVEFYGPGARLDKVLEARWREQDGLWFWDHLVMDNLRRKHQTVVVVDEVRHDISLTDDVFHESTLSRGAP
jgi:hypothetical protein